MAQETLILTEENVVAVIAEVHIGTCLLTTYQVLSWSRDMPDWCTWSCLFAGTA